jgi:hypothetical protein
MPMSPQLGPSFRVHQDDLLRFRYVNWKGVDYEYVVDPEGFQFGPFEKGGINSLPDAEHVWVMHGHVVTRNGDPREDLQTRRRTFILADMRGIGEVPRV